MRQSSYSFAAIVGQEEMKLALLLAAVDWRLGVLLRGDKGAGKTTTARGLAALLPTPAPFINLPIGATEDRLLGGLHLERTLKGDPVLKPGLLAEAHGGVLYVDEVNLLSAHLGDALLDTASSGVHVVEREGLSGTYPAEFVLLGSMNPEEGSLRPQLLDRFALSVNVCAPLDSAERRLVMERRIAFERDPIRFAEDWAEPQKVLQEQIRAAKAHRDQVVCTGEMMGIISSIICDNAIRSLRADLAVMRAAVAYAALAGDATVESLHITVVLPLVLGHRMREAGRSSPPTPPPPAPEPQSSSQSPASKSGQQALDRIFAPKEIRSPTIVTSSEAASSRAGSAQENRAAHGATTGSRQSESPEELDLRATLSHSLRATGSLQPRVADLHERVRTPKTGTHYLFVIDSSGSHAAQQRMRLVKGAISGLLKASFRRGDEAAMLVFRGTSAEVVLEPTQVLADALAALEYLPTGGRTPLAAGLNLALRYLTPSTLMVLLTDGRANVPLHGDDPWQDALDAARLLDCMAIVVDTEVAAQRLGQCEQLARTFGARYMSLEDFAETESFSIAVDRFQPQKR